MDQTLTRPPLDAVPSVAGPRQYGAVNWLGLWTLCLRETRRFWKVGMQTLFAPVVSSLLMLFVFKLAFGQNVSQSPGGVAFTGSLALAYRVCLWSRLASRVEVHVDAYDAAN